MHWAQKQSVEEKVIQILFLILLYQYDEIISRDIIEIKHTIEIHIHIFLFKNWPRTWVHSVKKHRAVKVYLIEVYPRNVHTSHRQRCRKNIRISPF